MIVYGAQLEAGSFASDPIPTTSAAVTRAIETARFSPLLEAVIQNPAASVVVRGQMDAAMGVNGTGVANACIVGGGNNVLLVCRNSTDSQQVATYQGVSLATGSANPVLSSPWGVGVSLGSSGRSLAKGGSTVASDSQPKSTYDLSSVYLNRHSGGAGVNFGNYDFVGISPERLTDTKLQGLAVIA